MNHVPPTTRKTLQRWSVAWLCIIIVSIPLHMQGAPSNTKMQQDLTYAQVGDRFLKLDLYGSNTSNKKPLIVWVHGGAWRAGNKSSMPLKSLVKDGFSIASVDYRLTPEARFPANVHDIKAAIRYLRANSKRLGINTETIIIAGASAGGHLAALVGVTNGHALLEGDLGEHPDASSDVQAIVSFYGASNLTSILSQSTPHGLSVRIPALQLLLGSQPEDDVSLAELASPVFHVESSDPPLLLIHGDQDPQMPINQSHELVGVYQQVGAVVTMEVIHGAAHGGALFYDGHRLNLVKSFLKKYLIVIP